MKPIHQLTYRVIALLMLATAVVLPGHRASAAGAVAGVPGETFISAAGRERRLSDAATQASLAAIAPSLRMGERRDLLDGFYGEIIAAHTDLEAFARCAGFAALLAGDDTDAFVAQLSYLTLDARDNWTAIAAGPWTRIRQRIHHALPFIPAGKALLRFGSTGFAADDKSNQAQHFWYSVAISYKWGTGIAEAVARYHEWNPPALLRWLPGTAHGLGHAGDRRLSYQGIALGRALADGRITPGQVGQWLREELS